MSVLIPFLRQSTPFVHLALVGDVCQASCGRVCWCSARGGERIETA
jgi:hypothetical protein